MSASSLNIESSSVPGGIVVALIGAADLDGIGPLEQRINILSAQRPPRVVFELSRMTFISSICMGALVRYYNSCRHWDGKVVLAGAGAPIVEALRRARLHQLFTFAASVEEALKD